MKTFRQFCESTDFDLLAFLNQPEPHHASSHGDNHETDKKIKDVDAKIAALDAELKNWQAKDYKPNSKMVTPGGADNMNSSPVSIGRINAQRRLNQIKRIDREILDLRADRKKLLDTRKPESVVAGETVAFYDQHDVIQHGKVTELIPDKWQGMMARIHGPNGATYVRKLSYLMKP